MSDALAAPAPKTSAPGHIEAILEASQAFLGSAHRWLDRDFGDIPRFYREQSVFWAAHELAGRIGRDSGSLCPDAAFDEVQDEETEAALMRLVGTFCSLMRTWDWQVWDDAELASALIERRRRRILRRLESTQESREQLARRFREFVCQARLVKYGPRESPAHSVSDQGCHLLRESDFLTSQTARIVEQPLSLDRPASVDHSEFKSFADSLALLTRSTPQSSKLETIGQLTPCQSDCIVTIRESNRRMTTTTLIEEMLRQGRDHGKSTTKNALAFLVESGQLVNRQDVNPKGYGLPEWD